MRVCVDSLGAIIPIMPDLKIVDEQWIRVYLFSCYLFFDFIYLQNMKPVDENINALKSSSEPAAIQILVQVVSYWHKVDLIILFVWLTYLTTKQPSCPHQLYTPPSHIG